MSYVLILRYLRFYLRDLICLMNNHTQDIQFSPLRSQPNPIVTLILRIVFVPLLIAIPVIFYALPALFVMETPPIFSTQADEIIFVIITYFILTGMYWYGFQYLKKIGSRAVVQMRSTKQAFITSIIMVQSARCCIKIWITLIIITLRTSIQLACTRALRS